LKKWHDWRQNARQLVDAASKRATDAGTTQAWETKWRETAEIYGKFPQWFTGVIDEARAGMISGQGTGYDWFDAISRYVAYDDEAIQTARTAGMELGKPATATQWQQTIDASRQYVDKTVVELFSAFKRYPTQDGLDMIDSGLRKAEEIGAATAQFLAKKREEMLPGATNAYYKLRNRAWAVAFDNVAVMNRVTQRLVLAQGLAQQVAGGLKWVDEFAGGEFQLVGRAADGFWEALNTATRETTRFADPGAKAALPSVPQQVLNDFYQAIGETESIIDNIVAELTQESAPVADTIALSADELELQRLMGMEPTTPPIRWEGPTDTEAAASPVMHDIKEEMKGAKEARQTIATEWNKVAKGEKGYLKLDSAVGLYVRNGIANVPENKFEDLYGLTVAGVEINSKADVDRLLQEYYNLGQVGKRPVAASTGPVEAITGSAPTYVTKAQVNDLRKQAEAVGIQTATRSGAPMDKRLINTLNKDLGLQMRRLDELPPERLDEAIAALQGRATAPVTQAAEELTSLGVASPTVKAKLTGFLAEVEPGETIKLSSWKQFFDDAEWVEAEQTLRGMAEEGRLKIASEEVAQVAANFTDVVQATGDLQPRIAEGLQQYQSEGGRIRLSDLAANFTDEEWPLVQRRLRDMQLQGSVSLFPIDDPRGLKEIDRAKAILIGGDERHVVYVRGDVNDFVPTPMESDMGAGILPVSDILNAFAKFRKGGSLYDVLPGLQGLDYFGLGKKGGNLYKLIRGLNDNVVGALGDKAPELGEVASHTIRTMSDAERKIIQRLPEILGGKPNTMTPAQQVRVIDALNQLLPQYDNMLAGATRVGEKMADYSMLNYNDKRYMDAALGFTFGYHFYFSRTGFNWIKRAIHKPGIVNLWYETQRGIGIENEQANVPEHLEGTIPNPTGIGPERLANPLTWMLPFASYMGNEFVNPDEAKTEGDRYAMYVQKYLPGLMPILGAALAAQQDYTSPLPNGKKRTDSFQVGDYVPLYRLGGYAYQGMTGDLGPQNFGGWGDEYDYGRAGKQVALQGMEPGADPGKQAWALDVGMQRQQGLDALPEQPKGVEPLWEAGAQAAGWDRFTNRLGSFLAGTPTYRLTPEEQQMRAMKEERIALGYDPETNPFGSRAAVWERTGKDGDLWDAAFNYSSLYPGMGPRTRPGVAAATNDYWNTVNPIFNQMNAGAADFVTQNPEATTSEMGDFKSPFFDKIMEGTNPKFPSVPNKVGEREGLAPRNTKYMNPDERARYELDRMMAYELPGAPERPAEGATPEVMSAYYEKKAAYEKASLDRVDQLLNRFLVEKFESTDPWYGIAKKLVTGEYASELLRRYENRNATEVEQHWNDRQTFVEEVTAAEWERRYREVEKQLGKEGVTALRAYYDLEKGEPRKEYLDDSPVASMALFAAYHPNEFNRFVDTYGQKGLDIAYKTQLPEHPGDGASESALKQYYNLRDSYNNKYPEAEEVRLWLWGRRFGAANGSDDYGLAHSEATQLFGPDIFQVINRFPSGGTKQEFSNWYNNHAEEEARRAAYFEWKREHNEEDRATLGQEPADEFEKVSNAGAGQGYIGPRPVGQAYVPIGANQWWDADAPTAEEQLAAGPSLLQQGRQAEMGPQTRWGQLSQELFGNTVNPWTQRAGELNAALFQGATIPDEMGGSLPGDRTAAPNSKTAADYKAAADKNYRGGRRSNRRSYYSRRRYYGGGGGYYGGGGGGGGSYFANVQMPDARGMNSSLWNNTDEIRAWRPWNNTADDWLRAGQTIGPDRIERWRK
jgi:hypothetical protein